MLFRSRNIDYPHIGKFDLKYYAANVAKQKNLATADWSVLGQNVFLFFVWTVEIDNAVFGA